MLLHIAVRDALRQQILSDELPAGSPLPSGAELCARFGASRGPVRQALAAEGLITTGQGRVPVVAGLPRAQAIDDFFSFSAWVTAMGSTPGQRTLEIARRRPSPAIAAMLGLGEDDLVVEVVRIRSIDGEVVMLERSAYIDEVGRLLFETDPDAGSLFAFLIDRGVRLDRADHTIDAVAADELDASSLDVPVGAPLLRVRRLTTSDDGTAIEAADDRYRPDRAALLVHNSRSRSTAGPRVARSMTLEGLSS